VGTCAPASAGTDVWLVACVGGCARGRVRAWVEGGRVLAYVRGCARACIGCERVGECVHGSCAQACVGQFAFMCVREAVRAFG
jgi:hypothetical protein